MDQNPNDESTARVAIALQGSFGHESYALGMMSAFQRHKVAFHAASGTVEMMLPLWLYFQETPIDIVDFDQKNPAVEWDLLLPSFLDADTWSSYFEGVWKDFAAVLGGAGDPPQLHLFANLMGPAQLHLFANLMGPALLVFNQQHFARRRQEYEKFMQGVTVPIFTNALNAANFHEIYLYSGPMGKHLDKIRGAKGKTGQREVLEMNLDRLIASGARAPFLAPIHVHLGAEESGGQERDEFWMEGAMRCNPPLNPLCDVKSTHILLIRFFTREMGSGQTHNLAELMNRYYEVIFSAPLEKETELIKALSGVLPPIEILDPADSDNVTWFVPEFQKFLQELDYSSHFKTPIAAGSMFKQGREMGEAIVAKYDRVLPKKQ